MLDTSSHLRLWGNRPDEYFPGRLSSRIHAWVQIPCWLDATYHAIVQ